MKKLLAVALLVCMLVPAFAFTAEAEVPAWTMLYRDFIENQGYINGMEATYYQGTSQAITFALHDMNDDDVPELLITNGAEVEANACDYLYRVSFGTVKYVGVIGGRMEGKYRYDALDSYPGLFYDYSGNNAMASTSYMYLLNGTLMSEEVTSTTNGLTTRVTQDDALYAANDQADEELQFHTLAEIKAIGWSAFMDVEGVDNIQTDNSAYEPVVNPTFWTEYKDKGNYKYIAITASSLNVRVDPDTGSDCLGSAANGATLTYNNVYAMDSNGKKWYSVEYKNTDGWVYANFSKRTNTKGGSTSTKHVWVSADSAYVRADANKSAKILGTAYKGDKLTCTGHTSTDDRGVKWYGVKFNGKTGWISSKMVTTKEVKPSPVGTKYIYVHGSSAYIRKAPDKDAKAYGTVHDGDVLSYAQKTATDDRGVLWYAVKYNGKTGWISSKMASPKKGGGGETKGSTVIITGSSSYVRKSADKDSKALGTVHKDDELKYLGKTSTDDRGVKWYNVQYNGKSGWVSSKMSKLKK